MTMYSPNNPPTTGLSSFHLLRTMLPASSASINHFDSDFYTDRRVLKFSLSLLLLQFILVDVAVFLFFSQRGGISIRKGKRGKVVGGSANHNGGLYEGSHENRDAEPASVAPVMVFLESMMIAVFNGVDMLHVAWWQWQ